MELKEFYRLICNEFNNGGDLEYKFTRKDGYWTLTKGFINTSGRWMSVHRLAEYVKDVKEARRAAAKKKILGRKPKAVITKHK